MSPHRRLPISARHAFALAFDLAVRRDAVHSLCLPLLLRAPWIVATSVVPSVPAGDPAAMTVALWSAVILLGDALTGLWIAGMLRVRAQSVFNTPANRPPGPVLDAYAFSLGRLPWLFVTEFLRNAAFGLASLFLFLPGVFLGFKLSMATEAVVLERSGPLRSFARSFRLTEGRFERWLEMVAISVVLAFGACFAAVLVFLVGALSWSQAVGLGLFLLAAVMVVVQYAWTFFYLRLIEIEGLTAAQAPAAPAGLTPAPEWSGSPRLRLVDPPSDPAETPVP
jgi:hypothetical protein